MCGFRTAFHWQFLLCALLPSLSRLLNSPISVCWLHSLCVLPPVTALGYNVNTQLLTGHSALMFIPSSGMQPPYTTPVPGLPFTYNRPTERLHVPAKACHSVTSASASLSETQGRRPVPSFRLHSPHSRCAKCPSGRFLSRLKTQVVTLSGRVHHQPSLALRSSESTAIAPHSRRTFAGNRALSSGAFLLRLLLAQVRAQEASHTCCSPLPPRSARPCLYFSAA